MIGSSPAKRYNVSLPPELAERLRDAGGGNLSAGIRLAEKRLQCKHNVVLKERKHPCFECSNH